MTHSVDPVGKDGTVVLPGAVTEPTPIVSLPLPFRGRRLAGSVVGGGRHTHGMPGNGAGRGIVADVR